MSQSSKDATSKAVPGAPSIAGLEILSILGRGGMGDVYKARQISMDRIVALKLLQHRLSQESTQLQRFRQEARISRKLSHPNIAEIYSFGVSDEGQPYFVMEYCHGKTLGELLSQTKTIPFGQLKEIIQQVCAALYHAHECGVVHRDLKPANIFIEHKEDGKAPPVKLIDFGIAKLLSPEGLIESQKLTATGIVLGSPLYMSPEQCNGKELDGRSDIYSLGCIMFQAIAGSPPFTSSNPLELAQMHVHTQPPSLSEAIGFKVEPRLEQLIARALAKDPAGRYATAAELRADLYAIAEPVVDRSKKVSSSKSFPLKLLAVLSACLLVSVAVGVELARHGLQTPHNSRLDIAEKFLNTGEYRQALPLLLHLHKTQLNDSDATNLAEDLCDLAKILQDDNVDKIDQPSIDVSPAAYVASVAAEGGGNHPSLFSLGKAQLMVVDIGTASLREEQILKNLQYRGLNSDEEHYLQGRMHHLSATRGLDHAAPRPWLQAEAQSKSRESYDKSIAELEQGRFKAPLLSVLLDRSQRLFLENKPAEAAPYVTAALASVPLVLEGDDRETAAALVRIAPIALSAGQKELAEQALKRAGQIYEEQQGGFAAVAKYDLASSDLAFGRGQYAAAAALLTAAFKNSVETRDASLRLQIVAKQAQCCVKLRQTAEALRLLEAIEKEYANGGRRSEATLISALQLGNLYYDLGRPDEAWRMYHKSLRPALKNRLGNNADVMMAFSRYKSLKAPPSQSF